MANGSTVLAWNQAHFALWAVTSSPLIVSVPFPNVAQDLVDVSRPVGHSLESGVTCGCRYLPTSLRLLLTKRTLAMLATFSTQLCRHHDAFALPRSRGAFSAFVLGLRPAFKGCPNDLILSLCRVIRVRRALLSAAPHCPLQCLTRLDQDPPCLADPQQRWTWDTATVGSLCATGLGNTTCFNDQVLAKKIQWQCQQTCISRTAKGLLCCCPSSLSRQRAVAP